ncbi:hypothetical protein DXG01_002869 [Tephrocybe rancida]|nr:hypothetical protein DXG01_002869 [Tephrocybe rancida]
MANECSICLSSFKEPVSIPCASPDLTYLPKKYHEFVVPNVRRVYVDATRQPNLQSLQKSLQLSKSKIQKLERDQEVLLQQCERHMAAAHAQAEGERAARETAAKLLQTIHDMEHEFRTVTTQAEDRIKVLEAGTENLHIKYEDLKYRYSKRKARHEYAPDVSKSI